MSLFDKNVDAFRQLKPTFTNKRLGKLGRYDDSGNIDPDISSGLTADYSWVRFNDDRAANRVKNLRVRREWGVSVWVEYNELTKEDEVREVHSILAPAQFGGEVAAALNAPAIPANVSTPVAAVDLEALAVRPDSTSGGLVVRILAGQTPHNNYQDGSTQVTLVPTATAGKTAFACIGIDADNAVVQTLSTDRAVTYPFFDGNGNLTTTGWADIQTVMDADRDTFWLWAFLLSNGATSIDLTKQKDLRLFNVPTMKGANGSVAGERGLVPEPAATDDVKFLRGDGTWATPSGASGALTGDVLPSTFEARLTLESGVAISTTDQTAKTTVYLTPHKGNVIALYDGASTWTGYALTEISLSLSGYTADTNYDIFVYDNAGTPTLESVAWTNATTRATALTLQNGVRVKSGATTRRYAGTIRTTASTGQCEDSVGSRYVWNNYHRVMRKLKVTDTTNSWTYASTTWRRWNNSTANRVNVVIGVNEELIEIDFRALAQNSSNAVFSVGIGLDSTSSNSADLFPANSSTQGTPLSAKYFGYVGIGYHYLQLLESGNTLGTTTFYGDGGSTVIQSGAVGAVYA